MPFDERRPAAGRDRSRPPPLLRSAAGPGSKPHGRLHGQEQGCVHVALDQDPGPVRRDHHDKDHTFVGPGDGKALPNPISGRMVVKDLDEYTVGTYSIHNNTIPHEFSGPRPHLHRHREEAFSVLEGELAVRVGSRTITAHGGLVRGGTLGRRPPILQPRDGLDQDAAHLLPGGNGPLVRRGSRGAHPTASGTDRSGGRGEARGPYREVRLRVRGFTVRTVGSMCAVHAT
jgi:mannose-6-phosphate isomerase-like protein (cupin superfamily)